MSGDPEARIGARRSARLRKVRSLPGHARRNAQTPCVSAQGGDGVRFRFGAETSPVYRGLVPPSVGTTVSINNGVGAVALSRNSHGGCSSICRRRWVAWLISQAPGNSYKCLQLDPDLL